MKVEEYRNTLAGIDTNRIADDRILEAVSEYRKKKLTDQKHVNSNTIRHVRSYRPGYSKLSVLKQAVPSFAYLILLLFAIAAFRLYVLQDSSNAGSGTDEKAVGAEKEEASGNSAEAETSDGMVPADDEAPIKDNGEFYYAWFDAEANEVMTTGIPYLVVRLHGTVDTIDPLELTDIVLTKDGVPVQNEITLTDSMVQSQWRFEDVTDFYFAFDHKNLEPGVYGLTGKYRGVPFTVDQEVIEEAVTYDPADPEDLSSVTYSGYTDIKNDYTQITDITIMFSGRQNSFYLKDLTDLKITLNNQELPFEISGITRHYDIDSNNSDYTLFSLRLKEALSEPGTYIVYGKYQGRSFTFWEQILGNK